MTSIEVWDSTNTTKIADLAPGPNRGTAKRIQNEPSTGSFVVPVDHPQAAVPALKRVVRFKEGSEQLTAVTVRKRRPAYVDPDEERAELLEVSGLGLLDRMNDAVVLPWVGAGVRPASRTRVFNFASPSLPTTSWTDTVYVQSRTSLLWGDDRPVGWLDPFASWIWGAPDATSHAAGSCYFRRDFTLAEPGLFVAYHSFDDEIDLWLDGCLVHSQANNDQWDNWWWTWRSPIALPAGTHTVAAKVTNAAATGPGGFILSGWLAAEGGGVVEDGLVVLTGAPAAEPVGTWKCKAYPTLAPGWTPGRIIRTLVQEAQGRGALTGWTLDFTDTVDSAGSAWPVIPEFSVPVGRTVGEAIADLAATWIDVDVASSGLVLRAWDKGAGGQGDTSTSVLAADDNITTHVAEDWI